MDIVNGRPITDSEEQVLAALIADAKQYWGDDLNDNSLQTLENVYRPVAQLFAEMQDTIGVVLDSSQIEYAQGNALDLLTALIGVVRDPAEPSVGAVRFSRGTAATTSYTIPKGTVVQTDSSDPIQFETTETGTIDSGETSATIEVKSLSEGVETNVGANTLVVMPSRPVGVETVTNPAATSGGTNRENDDELRDRAMSELANGSRASAPSLVNASKNIQGVKSVSIFLNDENDPVGGLPGHSFELVISGGNDNDIGQAILDTKAAGDTSHGGVNGTAVTVSADIGNGQTHDITFSRPNPIDIYIDATITKTAEFAGEEAVADKITEYIGGLRTSGNEVIGLGVGDDVLIGEVEYQIRSITGVHDVTDLRIGTAVDPTGTSNLAVSDADIAQTDALNNITVTTSNV